MTQHENATAGCLLVGEYVDEADWPSNLAVRSGEVVRPRVVEDFLDLWGRADGLREFTVLFKDGRVVVVRGHSLRSDLPRSPVFSIVVHSGQEEEVVALFQSEDIIGIFHGELRPDRKIA